MLSNTNDVVGEKINSFLCTVQEKNTYNFFFNF